MNYKNARYVVAMIQHNGKIGAYYYFNEPYFSENMKNFILDDFAFTEDWKCAEVLDTFTNQKIILYY